MLKVDSREKNNKHILNYLRSHEIPYEVGGLPYGDYYNGGKVCVERKASLLELSANLGKHHDRFRKELLKAKEANVHLIVLIEQPTTLDKVTEWTSDKTTKTGKWLHNTMVTVGEKYNVEWRFCHRLESGKKITEILYETNFE